MVERWTEAVTGGAATHRYDTNTCRHTSPFPPHNTSLYTIATHLTSDAFHVVLLLYFVLLIVN
jgi:hypothetical protein